MDCAWRRSGFQKDYQKSEVLNGAVMVSGQAKTSGADCIFILQMDNLVAGKNDPYSIFISSFPLAPSVLLLHLFLLP